MTWLDLFKQILLGENRLEQAIRSDQHMRSVSLSKCWMLESTAWHSICSVSSSRGVTASANKCLNIASVPRLFSHIGTTNDFSFSKPAWKISLHCHPVQAKNTSVQWKLIKRLSQLFSAGSELCWYFQRCTNPAASC